MKDFYSRLTLFVINKAKYILVAFLIATVFFGYMTTKLGVDSDIMKVMPQDDPIILDYYREQNAMGNTDVMIVAFFLKPETDPQTVAKNFYDRMSTYKNLKEFTKTDMTFFLSSGFLNVTNTDVIEQITQNVNNVFDAVKSANPYDFKSFEYLYDTLDGIYSLQQGLSQSEDNFIKSYYMLSVEKDIMIMGVSFIKPSTDLGFVNEVIPVVKKNLSEIEKIHGIKTGLTGNYIYSYEANKALSKDFAITTTLTMVFTISLFYIAFGNMITTVIVFICLILATVISMGITQMMFGQLNIITTFVASITVGLGIDYGQHLLTRFINDYKKNNNMVDALYYTYKNSLTPIFYGVITAIVVFTTLLLMRLPAFTQMSVMTIAGLFVFFIVMVFVVPAIMTIFKSSLKVSRIEEYTNKFFKKMSYFIPKNGKIIVRIVVPIMIIFSIIGAFSTLNFSYTTPGLVSASSESSKIGVLVLSKMGQTSFDSLKCAVRFDENIDDFKSRLLATGAVKSIESLPDTIEKQVGKYADLKNKVQGLSEVIANPMVASILKKYNIYSDSLKIIDIISRSSDLNQFSLNILEILPQELKSSFFMEKDGVKYIILSIQPAFDIWSNNGLKKFFDKIGKDNTDRILGNPKAMYKIMSIVSKRFILPTAVSFIFIAIFTYFSRKKNIKETLLTFFGLVSASLGTFGVGYFMGIRPTFTTLLTYPLVSGVGVEGFIHIFHAIDEDPKHYWQSLNSVTFSIATTIAAFISFNVSEGALLKQFATTMALSLVFSWVASAVLIPAINRKKIKEYWKKEKDMREEIAEVEKNFEKDMEKQE